MVLILGIAGAFCGITNTCIKFTGEIIAEGNFLEDPTLVIIFLSIVAFSAFFLLFSVNYCMRYYDQIDVMPTYFAQILINSVLCGLVLLDEYSYYTTNTLIGIIACSFISFIGIQILAWKSNKV